MTICPKCKYERLERDASVHAGICPACGIAYVKWLEAQAAMQRETEASERVVKASEVPVTTSWQRARHYVFFMPEGHIEAFWFHVLAYVLFVIWGLGFMTHGIDWSWIGSSFLHNVNLAFHEFGHVLFSPFGTFWTILGGSLFQILLPLIPLVHFMVWQRDNFPASLMLWWSGQNFIDVAPYIADAQFRVMPLTTGNEDSHDWGNLLTMTGTLDFADYYANLSFTIGVSVMLLSYAWGGCLLAVEFRKHYKP